MKYLVLVVLFISTTLAKAEPNLVLVTIDGLRWQEVFRGADEKLIANEKFVKNVDELKHSFWAENEIQRREKLMPFVWSVLAKQGTLVGDRDKNSKMSVANNWFFSYPGYNEIFTGVVDPTINSNKKFNNPQVSFLEWLNNKQGYDNKLAAFGSWDVFPYIFNVERSKLFVNAGFQPLSGYPLSKEIQQLNRLLLEEVPSPWMEVRLDAFTYHFAKDYLLKQRPRVMSISFGETDDFAHDGRYDHYLYAAKRTDKFLEKLWHTIQSMEGYKNNTVMLIVTDHGRGYTAQDWQHHASKRATFSYMKKLNKFKDGIVGSDEIWMAAIGPGVKSLGVMKTDKELKQKQIAATALTLLGENPEKFNANAGKPILEVIEK